MKAFTPPAGARFKLVKTIPRKEFAGEERRQAISLRLRWETTNDALTMLHPQLRDMLFWRPPQLEAQQDLPDLDQTVPCLRCPVAALPLKVEASYTGYTVSIEHGIDESTALELYSCTLDKFTVDAKEGGTAIIEWSVASNKEITRELVGELCDLEGAEIVGTLTPPAAAEPVIDGTTAAFKKDHPEAGGPDAGDLFAQAAQEEIDRLAHGDQHAGDFGQPDSADSAGPVESDSEGGETDITRGEGENWPFPTGDNQFKHDPHAAEREQAELEAGMAASIQAAGLQPKAGRRTRKAAGVVE